VCSGRWVVVLQSRDENLSVPEAGCRVEGKRTASIPSAFLSTTKTTTTSTAAVATATTRKKRHPVNKDNFEKPLCSALGDLLIIFSVLPLYLIEYMYTSQHLQQHLYMGPPRLLSLSPFTGVRVALVPILLSSSLFPSLPPCLPTK